MVGSCQKVHVSYLFLRRHLVLADFGDFAIVLQLPEDHIALCANREEHSSVWQEFYELDLLPMHCKSAVKFVQLSHVE